MRGLVAACVWLVPAVAWAGPTTYYVSADAPDCGTADGSSGAPFCTLAEAFAVNWGPGDRIWLRDASTSYLGATREHESGGNPKNPVVIEPEPGHSPVLEGTLMLNAVSNVVIRGLNFVSDGTQPVSAIHINGRSDGIRIEDNAFVDWAPPGYGRIIHVSHDAGTSLNQGLAITGNRITNAAGWGIRVAFADAPLIHGNVIDGLAASCDSFGGRHQGIFVWESDEALITNNLVRGLVHDPPACAAGDAVDNTDPAAIHVGRCDNCFVAHNLVEDIAGRNGRGKGIHLERDVAGTIVHHNVARDVEDCGLCLGRDGGIDTMIDPEFADVSVHHNTVYGDINYGLRVRTGIGFSVFANILRDATEAAVRLQNDVEPADIDFNLYWNNSAVADPSSDLAQWQAECGCDASAIEGDPLVPRADGSLTPPPTSPAIDGGDPGLVATFHGDAPDVGALEGPLALGAVTHAESPGQIELEVANTIAPPLLGVADCLGFTVAVDGDARHVTACEHPTDGVVTLHLATQVFEGQSVEVSYAGRAVTDTVTIGGTIGAELLPFTLPVENPAGPRPDESSTGDPPTPEDSTTGPDGITTGPGTPSPTTGTTGETDDAAGSAPDGPTACGCGPNRPPLTLLLLPLALALRPRGPTRPQREERGSSGAAR